MSSSLRTEPAAGVLQRLLGEEAEHDGRAFVEAGVSASSEFPTHLDVHERAERFKNVFMSIDDEGGELLYLMARTSGARTVVEYGTSFGVSTIYLACAVRDNGGGRVITTELQEDKARRAQENFAAAGVDDLVELWLGDARETLSELADPVDMVLLDGWPDLALPVLRAVEPKLRSGGLVLLDDLDVDFGTDMHGEFLDYVRDPANGYQTLKLGVADGIQASTKLA